ncbi:radical SAM protein, partial [Flavihumibacter cheonanensis]|uniref:radical SAM protein n=1 Tax=Flavihumibacter cheonanensis TaxID=1442385 RepID=UPI0034DB08BF
MQSGSNRILRAMRRRGTVASYLATISAARRAIPGLVLTTDIIVGFPGETDADFQASLDLVRELNCAHVHIFPFSPRPGTPAATLPHQVPPPVK